MRVDETAAMVLVDKVLGLECEMKREQLQLLIRTKHALTPEEQDRPRELTKAMDQTGMLEGEDGR